MLKKNLLVERILESTNIVCTRFEWSQSREKIPISHEENDLRVGLLLIRLSLYPYTIATEE